MQVQQIVRASADVVTITTLRPGDVYKRVDETYSGDAVLRFGVVESTMNNGEDAAVSAFEYTPDYSSGVAVKPVVFTGNKPVAIFPATPEEVAQHMDALVTAAQEASQRADESAAKMREALARTVGLRDRVLAGELTAPLTSIEA